MSVTVGDLVMFRGNNRSPRSVYRVGGIYNYAGERRVDLHGLPKWQRVPERRRPSTKGRHGRLLADVELAVTFELTRCHAYLVRARRYFDEGLGVQARAAAQDARRWYRLAYERGEDDTDLLLRTLWDLDEMGV